MTLIRFFRTRPTADGTRVPASGTLRFTPTRERVVVGDPDEVILPIGFSVQVPKDTGRADVDLAPTGPGWVWEVYSHSFGVTAEYAYVVVPEPVPNPDNPGEFLPVDEPDLVRVDKDTLDPAAVPDPLWWAELEAAKALASDVELARVDAEGSATSAAQSANIAGTARTGAETARDESVTASEMSVEASATAKTITGQAVEQAILPDGAARSALTAAIADSVDPVLGGYVEDAQASQVAAKTSETNAGLSATSAGTSAGTATTQANRAKTEADRAQTLANGIGVVATMRVDTSVGKRVFVSNGTDPEQMIQGDTGWRDIRGEFAALGNDPKYSITTLKICRINGTVYLEAVVSSTDSTFYPTLKLVDNISSVSFGYRMPGNYDWPVGKNSGTDFVLGTLSTNANLQAKTVPFNAVVSAGLRFVASWKTSDAWPTINRGISA